MRFYANEKDTCQFPNGSVGVRTYGSFSTWAKIKNCPVDGTALRLSVRCTGYADTFFSIPAEVTYRKKHIAGYITPRDEGIIFIPYEYGKNYSLLENQHGE